jgi:peptidoglycan L-alanyl-D-glutamate endopeptidase CwlK
MGNIDNITIERIALMHPNLRVQLEADYKECCLLLPPNKLLRFAQTLRTFKEQSDLYAIGRTVKGRKVTNAKAGKSYHNYGLAFDIVILIDKNNDGIFEEASYDVDTDWMKVIDFFKRKGWKWGGNFKSFKDYPHLEMSYGFTTTALLDK